jgi:hypothetical protein
MGTASAIDRFNNAWETVAGSGSELDKSLTVEERKLRRVLFSIPAKIIKALLDGVSVSAVEKPRVYSVCRQQTPRVSSIAAMIGGVGLVICGICALAGFVSAVIGLSAIVFIGSFIMKKRSTKAPVQTEELNSSMTSYDIEVSDLSVDLAVAEADKGMKDALMLAKSLEENAKDDFDIVKSRQFGEWVQKFADYCNDESSPGDLKILKGELFSKLRMSGIEVYDSIRRDKEGNVILPAEDSFKDARADASVDFNEVRHAVVTSREDVLAIGELA